MMLCFQDESGQPLFRSIHVDDVTELMTLMVSGTLGHWHMDFKKSEISFEVVTSHLLREYFQAGNNHPARDYPKFFSMEFPQAALSYEWRLSMLDVANVLTNPLVLDNPTLLADETVCRRRDGKANPRVWIDIFFIDQLANNIPVELGVAQEYYMLCILHIVAGSTSFLRRGWCLWELGLRAHARKESLIVGSLGNTVRPST